MRKIYDVKTKEAFLSAAREARKSGKSWQEAFAAATEAGYTGTRNGLKKMALYAFRVKSPRQSRRGRPARRGRGPGRPAGRPVSGRARGAIGGLDAIQNMVNSLVRQRVTAALDGAISALQSLKMKV